VKVAVELFPQRRESVVELPPRSDGYSLMKALGLAPDVHIVLRGGTPIPIDEQLHDGDSVRVIAVVSGG